MTNLLSVVKNPIDHIESDKEKDKCQKINLKSLREGNPIFV